MHSFTLLSLIAGASAAAIHPRAGWVSGPFAIKLASNDTSYDGKYLSPTTLISATEAKDAAGVSAGSVAGVDDQPHAVFYYLERTGQMFTATSEPAPPAADKFDDNDFYSWSYEAVHNNPDSLTQVSPKAGDMQVIYFAYESPDLEHMKTEKLSTYVSLDIIRNQVRESGTGDYWYICQKTPVVGGRGYYEALNVLQDGDDQDRPGCTSVTLKTVKVPGAN